MLSILFHIYFFSELVSNDELLNMMAETYLNQMLEEIVAAGENEEQRHSMPQKRAKIFIPTLF